MRPLPLIAALAALLLSGSALSAQEEGTSFSLEVGTGLMPLQLSFAPSYSEEQVLAKKGQRFNDINSIAIPISLSEVWRVRPHWELCLTEGICWKYSEIVQYDTFGIGPSGEPRYDLSKSSPAGYKATRPIGSMVFQARFIWVPRWKFTVYSSLGVGFTTATAYIPIPNLTPLAFRFGGEHLYFFAEATLGPVATFGHGGLGWRF